MSKTDHPHHSDPTLSPGADPSIHAASVEHRAALERLAASVAHNPPRAPYLPTTEHGRRLWISSFLSVANASRLTFPTVFNASDWRFNLRTLEAIWAVYLEYIAALEAVTPLQRFLTMSKNALLNASPEAVQLPPPRPMPAIYPKTTALHVGIVGVIIGMVDALRSLPNFTEADARAFGVLPQSAPHPDPATLDPEASARFTGTVVELTFRSPRSIRGVDLVQVLCDRGDGTGVHSVGTTSRSRFTDHCELPAPNVRAAWTYFCCFLDPSGNPVGQQSVCDVTVVGRVTAQ